MNVYKFPYIIYMININWQYVNEKGLPKTNIPLKEYLVAYHPKCINGEFASWEKSKISTLTLDSRYIGHPCWLLPLGWNNDGSVYAWAELDSLSIPELPEN